MANYNGGGPKLRAFQAFLMLTCKGVLSHTNTALLIDWRGDTLYLNPGSAGRRRFKLPVTLALLEVSPDAIEPSLVQLVD